MSKTQSPLLTDNSVSFMPASFNPLTDSTFDPPDLDPSILLAAELGFVIAPVLTKCRCGSDRSYIGAPSSDIDVIATAAARYLACNWTLHLGASNLAVLEIDTRIGYVQLSALCRNSFGWWTKTLQFRDATSRFLMFRSNDQRGRSLEPWSKGLKVHSGNAFLLVPPSSFVGSGGLAYVKSHAPIVDAPAWLLELAPNTNQREDISNRLLAA